MVSKSCFKCNEIKSLDEFYPHSGMADGHLNKCKACAKKDRRLNFKKNRKSNLIYFKERRKRPYALAAERANGARMRKKFSWKFKARSAVETAVKNGSLKRRCCEVCGTNRRVEAHHEDYLKPLQVKWLCVLHHRLIHKKYK